ncbi:MAG: hypothetical protein M1830_007090, partial [Pleopsidium flavum]
PKYPGAKLFYISVGKDTKLRLYNADEQALEKESTKPDKAYENVSWIACEGLANPNNHEWLIQKARNGTNNQKPLYLRCHSMSAFGKESSLDIDTRKNYEDTFDACYDYFMGVGSSNMVAPIHFARLATKRALLLMDRNDHTSDTAPFKLRPVNGRLKDTLYFI